MFPIDNMPQAIQYVTYVIPVRYYAEILRGIFLRGSGIDVLWPQATVLATMGCGDPRTGVAPLSQASGRNCQVEAAAGRVGG